MSERPEQEIVTNSGAAEGTELCNGVTVTVAVPAWPGVRIIVPEVAGVSSDTVTTKVESHWELTVTVDAAEVEPLKLLSPA